MKFLTIILCKNNSSDQIILHNDYNRLWSNFSDKKEDMLRFHDKIRFYNILLLSFCFNLHCQLHHNLICYELYWKRRCAIDCVPKSTQVNDLARLQMGNSSYWFVWWCNTLYNCWIASFYRFNLLIYIKSF